VVHLRLHFQLLLAPVFLWAWLVATHDRPAAGSERLTGAVVLAFLCLHVFLYGGATAFNSAYDRDTGPIGGLQHPPPVVRALLPFSVAVKLAGLVLAAYVGPQFLAIAIVLVLLSVAYSRSWPRLKGRPLGSLLTVGAGQGALVYAAGWAAVRGDVRSLLEPTGLLGALAATAFIVGLYPLTQLFQVDEDRARGDRTVAVAWGAATCFTVSLVAQAVGGLAMLAVLARLFGPGDALVVGAGLLAQFGFTAWWATRFEPAGVLANFHRVMRMNAAGATGLGLYLLVRGLS
ncbi:MAG TPA: UbiA family prenyltransferase, partial [Candidatus Dormibacteraeota bacterium]|nr:UbiA family prenyltransferase [Candidatus Dormibacteraeota bacterium]